MLARRPLKPDGRLDSRFLAGAGRCPVAWEMLVPRAMSNLPVASRTRPSALG
jgi:hypothetical protein